MPNPLHTSLLFLGLCFCILPYRCPLLCTSLPTANRLLLLLLWLLILLLLPLLLLFLLLQELVTVRIGGGQLFFAACKSVLPFLSQLVAALAGRLLPLVRANVQLLGEQQLLHERLDKQLEYCHEGDPQQQTQQPQQRQQQPQGPCLQEEIERMQRKIFAHSETWEDMSTVRPSPIAPSSGASIPLCCLQCIHAVA